LTQSKNQLAETPVLAFKPHPTSSTANGIDSSEVNLFTEPTGDEEDAGNTIATARTLRQMPLTGVVDAILEVGNQRKAILGRLRSALVCGNDSEAIGFARQLCGLAT
jgi:hypothetical protein